MSIIRYGIWQVRVIGEVSLPEGSIVLSFRPDDKDKYCVKGQLTYLAPMRRDEEYSI